MATGCEVHKGAPCNLVTYYFSRLLVNDGDDYDYDGDDDIYDDDTTTTTTKYYY